MLYQKIVDDWKSAVKSRDSVRASTLGNFRSALLSSAIALGVRDIGLDDQQVISVLMKLRKQGEEAIAMMPPGTPLRAKEEAELEVLRAYLPQTLSASETRERVYSILKDSQVRDLAGCIRLCMATLKPVADGRTVKECVQKFIEENQ
jgi:uncharacterized protein YqeY